MLLELRDLGLTRGARTVFSELSLGLAPGERVVLLGVNGVGKTTLLKMVAGLLDPSAGAVRYEGTEVATRTLADPGFRRRFRSEVGLVFQNVDAMLFNPTVADEIAFGPRQLGLPDLDARVARWADAFELGPLLDVPPFELSGGEKKRVALAAVLAMEPRLLLLDEVTAGLDPAWSARLVDLLDDLPGLTTLASTHHVTQAGELGRRAVLLKPGHPGAFYDGPTDTLLADLDTLIDSGLAHRHRHRHAGEVHTHFHVHDTE